MAKSQPLKVATSSSKAKSAAKTIVRTGVEQLLQANPALLDRSPAVLYGSLEKCVETLQERRERYGFSYINLGGDVESTAPLVARLAES